MAGVHKTISSMMAIAFHALKVHSSIQGLEVASAKKNKVILKVSMDFAKKSAPS